MSEVGLGSEGDGISEDIQSLLEEDHDAIMTDPNSTELHHAAAAMAAAQRAQGNERVGSEPGSRPGTAGGGAGVQGRQLGQAGAQVGSQLGLGNIGEGMSGLGSPGIGNIAGQETIMQTGDAGLVPINPPSICLCQQPQRIPRPRNAFILFRQHHHASVVSQHPGKSNPEISKIIGELWRESTPETKAVWQKHADNEKRQHLARFPEYRYQPRRNQSKKGPPGSAIGSSTISLESAICPNCGGRTGLMSAPGTPATPATPMSAVPRNMRTSMIPQTPTTARLGQSMTLPPVPSTPRTPRRGKQVEQETTSKGVEALLQLGLRPESAGGEILDDGTQTPTGSPLPLAQAKKRKLNQILSQTAMMREMLATPGLPTARDLEGMDFLHTADLLKTAGFPDTEASAELEQQFAALQAQAQAQAYAQASGILDLEPAAGLFTAIEKLHAIRKICKPLPALPTPGAQTRGAVIAIEGEDRDTVTQLVEGLAENLKHTGERVDIQIITEADDLELSDSTNHPDRHILTSQLLLSLSKWHRISSSVRSIVLKTPPTFQPESSTTATPAGPSESPPTLSPNSSTNFPNPGLLPSAPSPSASSTANDPSSANKVPIVLFNRYILTRSDLLSRLPLASEGDNITPLQHWQWLASLWRGCVGADMTIVIKIVEGTGATVGRQEEVETRDDARILVVKKVAGRQWSEKTIRRLGFEVSECVRTLQGFME